MDVNSTNKMYSASICFTNNLDAAVRMVKFYLSAAHSFTPLGDLLIKDHNHTVKINQTGVIESLACKFFQLLMRGGPQTAGPAA